MFLVHGTTTTVSSGGKTTASPRSTARRTGVKPLVLDETLVIAHLQSTEAIVPPTR